MNSASNDCDSSNTFSFPEIPVDIPTKTDSNQTFSLLHNSIDRFLKEHKKSFPNITRHNGVCARNGILAEQHIKDIHSTNNCHVCQHKDQCNNFNFYQVGLSTKQDEKEWNKMSEMDTGMDKCDPLTNRDTDARTQFDIRKPMLISTPGYRIDNVSSITEKEFNSIQESPSSLLDEESFSPSCQEGIEMKRRKISHLSDKDKPFYNSPENSKMTDILQQSQTMFEDNTSAQSILPNTSPCKESNMTNTDENSQKSDRYNLPPNSRFHKKFRSKSPKEVTENPSTTSDVNQNFPYLNRNAILFDKNGISFQRFIVRSDGIICPVKQVSAFSVGPQQHTTTQQKMPNPIALDTDSSEDKFRREKETMEEEYNNKKRRDAQRYNVLSPRNEVEKYPPLQLDKLAVQARAFKKFQYLLALRFRRYFLHEYERSRRFYGIENKANVRSESQTFGKLDITNRSTMPNQNYGDIEPNMNCEQYTQRQLLNDFDKRSRYLANDVGLNSYFEKVNYVNQGIESGQISSSSMLKMPPNNPGYSYDGTQNDVALDFATSDFWHNRIRYNGNRNSNIDNMDEFIDRSTRGLNTGTTNSINATHIEYPFGIHDQRSHIDDQHRFTMNDNHYGSMRVENSHETFSGRKEFTVAQNNIDSFQVRNPFQDVTDSRFTCNPLSNPSYHAHGQSAFRSTHPFNDTTMFQIENTERMHPQWRQDAQVQNRRTAEMNYPQSQQHSAKLPASFTTDMAHNRGNSSLAMPSDPGANQRPDAIFSYNATNSPLCQAKETYPMNLSQRF